MFMSTNEISRNYTVPWHQSPLRALPVLMGFFYVLNLLALPTGL